MATQAISNLGANVPVRIRSELDSWGVLRVIEVGPYYSIVIHPKQFWEIHEAIKTADIWRFTAEDGTEWSVSPDNQGQSIRFYRRGTSVTVDLEALGSCHNPA